MPEQGQESRRGLILSTRRVDGYYAVEPHFRLLPPDDLAPRPPAAMGHHPAILEFRFESPPARYLPIGSGPENGHELPYALTLSDAAADASRDLLSVLSTLLDSRFFQYGSGEQAWFVPLDDVAAQCQWGQLLYNYAWFNAGLPIFSPTTESPLERLSADEYFTRGRSIDQALKLPSNVDELCEAFFCLDQEAREAFLASCALFGYGLDSWKRFRSISWVALISSLETLVAYDTRDEPLETCKGCGQKKYHVMAKFRRFVRKYTGLEASNTSLNLLYEVRNRVVHRGELLISDRRFGDLFEPGGIAEMDAHELLYRLARLSLVNWLLWPNQGRLAVVAEGFRKA